MSKENITLNPISDLEEFKSKILEHIKAGKPLNGKNGVLTPLIKEITRGPSDRDFTIALS